MSNYSVMHDVTIELRRQLFRALETAPDIDFSLTDVGANIILAPPADERPPAALASLYLYHVGIDPTLRNQRALPDPSSPDGWRRPPLPLQLRYLLTPIADDEGPTNHVLYGRALQFFHDNPLFETLSGDVLGDSFGGASATLRVVPDYLTTEQLTNLWSGFGAPFRLSLALRVDVVAIDSARPLTIAPRVEQALVAAGLKAR